MACNWEYDVNGVQRHWEFRYHDPNSGMNHYTLCAGDPYYQESYTQTPVPSVNSLAPHEVVGFVLFAGLCYLMYRLYNYVEDRRKSARIDIDDVQETTFSENDPSNIIRDKLIPPRRAYAVPFVERMGWEFGEPANENDHTVRFYLALSAEERAYIKRHGYNEDVLLEEPLFEEADLLSLASLQRRELMDEDDADTRASLRIEHKIQMQAAKEQTIGRTVEDYLAYPYTKDFPRRSDMRRYQQVLERKVIGQLREWLKEIHAD